MPSTVLRGVPGYDVVAAASDYSNVTGLVSGFAKRLRSGLPPRCFALGFVGCLLCAYSFFLRFPQSERASVATLTSPMLVGSAISVSLVAVLGGFVALAKAFLPETEPVFLAVCGMVALVSPSFVWFPQMDIVRQYGPPAYEGPRSRSASLATGSTC